MVDVDAKKFFVAQPSQKERKKIETVSSRCEVWGEGDVTICWIARSRWGSAVDAGIGCFGVRFCWVFASITVMGTSSAGPSRGALSSMPRSVRTDKDLEILGCWSIEESGAMV